MRPAIVAIATYAGIGVLAMAFTASGMAQVMGVTVGAPFTNTDAGVSTAPPYGPYADRGEGVKGLTPDTVEDHLRSLGFTSIANLRLRGGSYVCEATGPRRERVRLVVDAASGHISGLQVIGFEDKRY